MTETIEQVNQAFEAAHKAQPEEHIADAMRQKFLPKADGHVQGLYPWWHGWALRHAFIAGMLFERGRHD